MKGEGSLNLSSPNFGVATVKFVALRRSLLGAGDTLACRRRLRG